MKTETIRMSTEDIDHLESQQSIILYDITEIVTKLSVTQPTQQNDWFL